MQSVIYPIFKYVTLPLSDIGDLRCTSHMFSCATTSIAVIEKLEMKIETT